MLTVRFAFAFSLTIAAAVQASAQGLIYSYPTGIVSMVGHPFLQICNNVTYRWNTAAGVGDIDGDGIDDFVGTPITRSFSGYGCYGNQLPREVRHQHVFSGASGAILFATNYNPNSLIWQIGLPVDPGRPAGDVDGDGFGDALVVDDSGATVYFGPDGQRTAQTNRLARSMGGIGDVNLDGFDDVIALVTGTDAEIFFGPDLAASRIVHAPAGCAAVAARGIDDVDGDRVPDLLVGCSTNDGLGLVHVLSGVDDRVLVSVTGSVPQEALGSWVAALDDVDGDDVPDFAASGAARVVLCSGATGTILRQSNSSGEMDAVGDVNADGVPDLSIQGAGVVSGVDFAVLTASPTPHTIWRPAGDLRGDGSHDVIASRSSGVLEVRSLSNATTPRRIGTRGSACVGSNGRVPRILGRGQPRFGGMLDVELRGGRPGFATSLHIGLPASFDLTPIGMPGCSLLERPFHAIPRTLGPRGLAAASFALQPTLLPAGVDFTFQWFSLDPAANSIGVTLSDALDLRLAP